MGHPHRRQPFPATAWTSTTTAGVRVPEARPLPRPSAQAEVAFAHTQALAPARRAARNPLLLAELVSLAVASVFWLLSLAVAQLAATGANAAPAAPTHAVASTVASAVANVDAN